MTDAADDATGLTANEPGWYVDLYDSTKERHWDGQKWNSAPRVLQKGGRPTFQGVPATLKTPPNHAVDSEADYRARMLGIAEAQLAAQERTATNVAVITWITVILLVLGVVGGIISYIVAT